MFNIILICDTFLIKTTDLICMSIKGGKKAIVDRIGIKAAEIGISKFELATKTNIAKNTFANWAVRGTIPPADTALAIADVLQCSVRWLITGINDKQEVYSIEEKKLIHQFRMLDKQGQFEVNALLEAKTVPVDGGKK